MNKTEKEECVIRLKTLSKESAGRDTIAFAAQCLGSIPLAGGAIAGAGAHLLSKQEGEFKELVVDWAELTDEQISSIIKRIDELDKKPTLKQFSALIHSVIGFYPKPNENVPVILNPNTIEEFQSYVQKGWIRMSSTNAICSMGAGNRVGNHLEDRKRSFGLGNGFVITIPTWEI